MPRALVLAPDRVVAARIEEDLVDHVRFEHVTVDGVADALRRSPQPQILVVDIGVLDAAETLQLHAAREAWFGSMIALGTVSADLKKSLGIERVVEVPLERGALRSAIRELGLNKPTARMKFQKK